MIAGYSNVKIKAEERHLNIYHHPFPHPHPHPHPHHHPDAYHHHPQTLLHTTAFTQTLSHTHRRGGGAHPESLTRTGMFLPCVRLGACSILKQCKRKLHRILDDYPLHKYGQSFNFHG